MAIHRQSIQFRRGEIHLRGTLMLPSDTVVGAPAVAQGPGWLGFRSAKLRRPCHEALGVLARVRGERTATGASR